ncbi:hypothetical protein HAX54_001229 [Datura stramonium]|uniref:Uncharacterized protein n=1 Tax=Datura stramonium TaxID=4076 RepID=A0ABS8T2Q3_DATST|nr:hypothetical protein [Datura stramonium]
MRSRQWIIITEINIQPLTNDLRLLQKLPAVIQPPNHRENIMIGEKKELGLTESGIFKAITNWDYSNKIPPNPGKKCREDTGNIRRLKFHMHASLCAKFSRLLVNLLSACKAYWALATQ